jgi:uncharacterized membrane protein HdeD (DUF308 family)
MIHRRGGKYAAHRPGALRYSSVIEAGSKPQPESDAAAGSLPPLRPGVREALERNWKWLLASGVLAILAGIVAIAIPAAASVTIELFIGWLLVFSSGFQLVDAFAPPRTPGRIIVRLTYVALFLAAGIYLLVAPLEGTFTLTAVLAAFLIGFGLVRLYAALRGRDEPGAALVALSGAAGIALGVLIAVELPSSADWAIGLLVGVDLLFYGFTAMWTALAGRELARAE